MFCLGNLTSLVELLTMYIVRYCSVICISSAPGGFPCDARSPSEVPRQRGFRRERSVDPAGIIIIIIIIIIVIVIIVIVVIIIIIIIICFSVRLLLSLLL